MAPAIEDAPCLREFYCNPILRSGDDCWVSRLESSRRIPWELDAQLERASPRTGNIVFWQRCNGSSRRNIELE
jgi:hypothetical protein